MSEKTLYLVQSHFANTEATLSKLDQIYTAQDSMVLMGDAVLAADSALLQHKTQLYMLENDAELIASPPRHDIKIINYTEFSDLVLSFQRCISLK